MATSNPMLGPDAWRHRTNITLAQADAACAGAVAATEKKYRAVIEATKSLVAAVEKDMSHARRAFTGIDALLFQAHEAIANAEGR